MLDLLQLLDEKLGNPDKAKSMGIDLARFAIRLHRFKCRFTTPTSGGWADALVNFSFVCDKHKHVAELQLQHKTLLVVRKEGKAHEAYASFRSAFELLEAIGREPKDEFEKNDPVDELAPVEALRRELTDTKLQLSEVVKRLEAIEKQTRT